MSCIAALDQDTAVSISDVIQSAPTNNKYDVLKMRLLPVLELQESERAEQLLALASVGLGDRTSSQLMEESSNCSLQNLSVFYANRFSCASSPQLAHAASSLISTVADPSYHTVARSMFGQPTGGKNLGAHTKHRAQRRSAPTAREDWCYFHREFGKAARKCQLPCSFSGNARAGHQPQ